MALQGSDFINPRISILRRVLFGVAALMILFPSIYWLNIAGFALLIFTWTPALRIYITSRSEKKSQLQESMNVSSEREESL
ncbi:MAG: hypothetical protein DRP87_09045 [Spirochaetes bacterium]|nr:MAG: hypothetical protein DRP87_09045 [Spirochaetota bacterium]